MASQVVLVVKNPPAKAGDSRDVGPFPGSGRSPGIEDGNPLQHSCLENSMDRGDWQATVRGVAKESDKAEQLTLSLSLSGILHILYIYICV